MGLLDFLKRRMGRGMEGPGPRAGRDGPSVRYVFAHQALRSVAFENPGGFLAAMSESNPGRQALLRDLWGQVRDACPWDAQAAPRSPSFTIRPFFLRGFCGILIELPEPRRPAEAYFAAVVVRRPESAEPPRTQPPPTWYFTLERTIELPAGLRPAPGNQRLVKALRADPRLLVALLGEPMFRAGFFRDLKAMLPHLARDPGFAEILVDLLRRPERLVDDPTRLALFLDAYEARMPPTDTVLCGWTAEGAHHNYGPGPRPDYLSFLAELAVWFLAGGEDEPPYASVRPSE